MEQPNSLPNTSNDGGETEPLCKSSMTNHCLSVVVRPRKNAVLLKIFFGFLSIVGLTGQSITLPLWVDSSGKRKTATDTNESFTTNGSNGSEDYQPFTDQYFVLTLANFSFAFVFGVAFGVKSLLKPKGAQEHRRLPHKHIIPCGCLFGTGAIFIYYASSGKRTAPYLQAILGNISIPMTLVFRYLLLKKIPTRRKLICAAASAVSLVVCLLPSIVPAIDPHNDANTGHGGARGIAGILWPLCFMTGFVVCALSNISLERIAKMKSSESQHRPDILYILFWVQIYEFLFLLLFFWVDALPGFGNVSSIQHVGRNFIPNFSWVFGMQCFFGGAGCSSQPGGLGTLFITLFLSGVVGSIYLLRYCEGATFLAIVQSVATPLGFLFWTLFKEQPSFHWHPVVSTTTWLNIAGLVIMVPAIGFYNTGLSEKTAESKKKEKLLN